MVVLKIVFVLLGIVTIVGIIANFALGPELQEKMDDSRQVRIAYAVSFGSIIWSIVFGLLSLKWLPDSSISLMSIFIAVAGSIRLTGIVAVHSKYLIRKW